MGKTLMAVRSDEDGPIASVRAFNRFYTRRLGLLGRGLHDSRYSLTEVRVLYELAAGDGTTASALARALGLDLGYVSRLVSALQTSGLVRRSRSQVDRRETLLALTAKGRRVFEPIERATREQVGALLADVPPDRRAPLLQAMRTIRRALEDAEAVAAEPYLLRDPRPGDLGWVVHRQAALYADEYGWDERFEGLLARIVATYVERFDPVGDHCWIAEREGAVVGAVFVVRKSARTAQLRMLYVEPSARGLGIGARLVDACIAFSSARGYRTLMLWTNDVLASARKIYRAAGFERVRDEPHRAFGKDLVGQYWSLEIARRHHA